MASGWPYAVWLSFTGRRGRRGIITRSYNFFHFYVGRSNSTCRNCDVVVFHVGRTVGLRYSRGCRRLLSMKNEFCPKNRIHFKKPNTTWRSCLFTCLPHLFEPHLRTLFIQFVSGSTRESISRRSLLYLVFSPSFVLFFFFTHLVF